MVSCKPYSFEVSDDNVLTLNGPSYEEIFSCLVYEIAMDKDEKIRAALIELGWTPPKEEENDQD